jgi:hypothetical protein
MASEFVHSESLARHETGFRSNEQKEKSKLWVSYFDPTSISCSCASFAFITIKTTTTTTYLGGLEGVDQSHHDIGARIDFASGLLLVWLEAQIEGGCENRIS